MRKLIDMFSILVLMRALIGFSEPCIAASLPILAGVLAKAELGPQAVQILSGSTRVEAFRVERLGETSGSVAAGPVVGGCRIIATGKEQGAAFASRLASALLSDRAYQGIGDLCMFRPGVALRSWRGREHVDTVICLHCGDIVLAVTDDAGKPLSETEARLYTIGPQLTSLLKEAFPTDRQIQGLPTVLSISAAQFAKRAYPILIVASRRGYTDVVRAALASGTNPNVVFDTETPLGAAISGSHLEIVKMLVAAGADVSVGSAGSTLMEQARRGRNDEIVHFLLAHGAKE